MPWIYREKNDESLSDFRSNALSIKTRGVDEGPLLCADSMMKERPKPPFQSQANNIIQLTECHMIT